MIGNLGTFSRDGVSVSLKFCEISSLRSSILSEERKYVETRRSVSKLYRPSRGLENCISYLIAIHCILWRCINAKIQVNILTFEFTVLDMSLCCNIVVCNLFISYLLPFLFYL